jgi:hypothetical protein
MLITSRKSNSGRFVLHSAQQTFAPFYAAKAILDRFANSASPDAGSRSLRPTRSAAIKPSASELTASQFAAISRRASTNSVLDPTSEDSQTELVLR